MLEPYKEIVNYEKYFFFEGIASLKYGGDYNKYRSEKTGEKHFTHRMYYDVEIKNVRQVSTKEFRDWNKRFELRNIKNDTVVVQYNSSEYELITDVLYLHDSIQPAHVQYEGDELHSEFVAVPVLFKMHRTEEGIVCKKGFPTGREEYRDGLLYREITTGELEPDGETCSTEWIPEDVQPKERCIPNKPTGNREIKGKCYRLEFYSGSYNKELNECETYWGEWKCEEEGRDRIPKGCTSIGCMTPVFWFLVLLWAYFCVNWTIQSGSFLPILLGIGIPLFLVGFGFILNILGRFSLSISRIFRWILNLLLLLFILSILDGVLNFIEGVPTRENPYSQDSWTDQDVQEINPNDSWDDYVDNGTSDLRKKVAIHLKWKDYSQTKYQGTFYLFLEEIRNSSYNLNQIEDLRLGSYGSVYKRVYNQDRHYLNNLYLMLDSVKRVNEQNETEFANTIVSMVQSFEYTLILDRSCNDPIYLNDKDVRQLLSSGVSCEGEYPYGIKTPVQFLSSLKGDCDTRTLLLYTIFKHYDYEVAIVNSDYYKHSILGISLKNGKGAYKVYNGKKYYLWETTAKGYELGELDRQMRNLNYWNVELN